MNFIEIYDNVLTSEQCKEIVDFFEIVPDQYKHQGQVYGAIPGKISIDKNHKDSIDIWCNFRNQNRLNVIIAKSLLSHIRDYRKKYPEIDNVSMWELCEEYNLQKYLPGQGYHMPHCENSTGPSPRILAWMIYLNTVTDKGGTYFTNYDITTEAVEGRLVIWPAYWTHTHHGVTSPSQTKYIATGWYSFIPESK